ncbi:MAG TPA: tail fiber domain-containing protein [Pyrinomonadaceae bacterium]|jgi:hypothetical protein
MKPEKSLGRVTRAFCLLNLIIFACCAATWAQSSTFTYQGRLNDSQAPGGNGSYLMKFELYADSSGATLVDTVEDVPVTVSGNVFTVQLNFTAANAFDGTDRFLKISVKRAANEAYTPLNPLQPITSVPYSIKSKTADTAQNALAIGGTLAANVIKEGDARLTDSRQPTAGSGNYIQNTNAAQTASFNITGNGIVGGSLSGNDINSLTGYKINNVSVLKLGTDSIFVGANSGISTTGDRNAFFGNGAGFSNSNGRNNSFVGFQAGNANTSGENNSFVGANSGLSNTTGVNNSFFGTSAGATNTTGGFNAFFGTSAGATNSQGFYNAFFGAGAGQNNTSGSNTFVGSQSGKSNTSGSNNAFVGALAGEINTTGGDNSFFGGGGVGSGNTTGRGNSFFGAYAGYTNSTGSNNTVVGADANVGSGNLTFATAIGAGALVNNNNSVVLGRAADTVRIPGNLNLAGTFTGNFTVPAANVTGTLAAAQIPNLDAAKITSGMLDNARLGIIPIANGGTGSATQNFVDLTTNQIVGGNKTFSATLSGNTVNSQTQYNIGGNRFLSIAGTNNTFVGIATGTTGSFNVFVGNQAGNANTVGQQNVFVGLETGLSNTEGNENTFVGSEAGRFNTTGQQNVFVGEAAGQLNSTGSGNSFFGRAAGANSKGSNNTFVGKSSGFDNSTGFDNTFVGFTSGSTNTSGQGNSSLGAGAGEGNTVGNFNTFVGAGAKPVPNNLTYATAIGAGAIARFSNTIVLGRESGEDLVRIFRLGSAGATALCRNEFNEIANCSSSLRYKTNIAPFDFGLNLVKQLRPITFDWKTGGRRDLGLGAEDVAKVEPLLVAYNQAGEVEGVKYDRLGVVLLNAVKEQQSQIEQQQNEIKQQRKQLDEQQKLIDGLRRLLCSNNPNADVCRPEIDDANTGNSNLGTQQLSKTNRRKQK